MVSNESFYRYETQEGDTFDSISLDFYDDEKYASSIMQRNPDCINYLVLPAGIDLIVPVLENQAEQTLPPWQR
jgi:phage tail protein X